MQLHEIGELKLLREIKERFSSESLLQGSGIIVGIGDDAAVIAPQNKRILITTDMMNEGVHFDLGFTAPFHLGFKLVTANVSDIMAMGGQPEYLFLNISMKKDADKVFFRALYDGISAAMDIYGVRLAGGDLCAAINDMVLSATVIGYAEKAITRAGARVGDKIYVTGTLGDSACGLEILKRATPASKRAIKSYELGVRSRRMGKTLSITHNASPLSLNLEKVRPLLMRHLMPVARDSSRLAIDATSMIDVSDGLFIDLSRICDESNVGARVFLDKIPMSPEMEYAAEKLGLDPMALAGSGGEDYELLFTASGASRVTSRESGVNVTCIGEIIKKKRVIVDKSGKESEMKARGYQHFGPS